MISLNKIGRSLPENARPVGVEQVSLLDSVGRVLAHDMPAPWDMPLWDNSAMDGYAVRSADCGKASCTLKVTGYIPAGSKGDGISVEPGCAVRIMTGAPTPPGCDAVVPVEETDDGRSK
jgi:molybdopterin molybdotransferase